MCIRDIIDKASLCIRDIIDKASLCIRDIHPKVQNSWFEIISTKKTLSEHKLTWENLIMTFNEQVSITNTRTSDSIVSATGACWYTKYWSARTKASCKHEYLLLQIKCGRTSCFFLNSSQVMVCVLLRCVLLRLARRGAPHVTPEN